MKKSKIVLTAFLTLLLLVPVFIKETSNNSNHSDNSDSLKFKQEYESLNEANNGERKYKPINIPDDNPMVYATYEDIESILKNKTGVIYFGFPECPWCRNAVPALIDAAKELDMDKIYYFNALEIRDIKSLDENGNIIVEKEGTAEYKKLVQLLYDYLEIYDGLNDSTIKRLYFPTVVFVKDGEIIGSHIGTIKSHSNPNFSLNNEQYNELKNIYTSYMLKMLGTVCENDKASHC